VNVPVGALEKNEGGSLKTINSFLLLTKMKTVFFMLFYKSPKGGITIETLF